MNGMLNSNGLFSAKKVFKAIFITAICLCGLASTAFAQSGNRADSTINKATVNQTSANFPGGMENFYNYVHANIRPDSTCWPGRTVLVRFTVDKNGEVRHARIRSKMLSKKMTAQLVNVFERAPKWTPAQQNGLAVREHFICPVMFTPQTELVARVK